MAVSLAPTAHMQFFDSAGNPLANGKVFTFQAGTSTPLATYTDSTGGTPNANPIILDAAGFANIWLTNNIAYKFQVQNSASVTQWTVDNILNTVSPGFSPQRQIFSNSGNFTIPVGVTSAKVTVVAGGGAGGGASAAAGQAAGGGSGGMGIRWLTGLTSGNTLTVAVGTGGVGAANAIGGNGVASSVSSGTQIITTITANPGQGGAAVGGNFGGPGGGIGTGGDVNWGGTQATHAPSIANVGSPGAPGPFGGGGAAGFQAAGTIALAPGGGGGAAGGNAGGNVAGGAGAAGVVIFEWVA